MKPIRVFNRTMHRKMWNWLAEHPLCSKSEWPGLKQLFTRQQDSFDEHYYCAASCTAMCTWVNLTEPLCRRRCPLDWGESGVCYGEGSLYRAWQALNDRGYACQTTEICRHIAELSVRESPDFITIII